MCSVFIVQMTGKLFVTFLCLCFYRSCKATKIYIASTCTFDTLLVHKFMCTLCLRKFKCFYQQKIQTASLYVYTNDNVHCVSEKNVTIFPTIT